MKSSYACCGQPDHSKERYEWDCGCYVEIGHCRHGATSGTYAGGPLVCTVPHSDDVLHRRTGVRDPHLVKREAWEWVPDYSTTHNREAKIEGRQGSWVLRPAWGFQRKDPS